MTRAEILAETLARLEAERYAPRASWSLEKREPVPATAHTQREDLLPPVTRAEGEENMRRVMAALGDDAVVTDFYERRAG